ncbi:MAG: hypothetical protein RL509_1061, partial [Pseudomonadota bacterium]
MEAVLHALKNDRNALAHPDA